MFINHNYSGHKKEIKDLIRKKDALMQKINYNKRKISDYEEQIKHINREVYDLENNIWVRTNEQIQGSRKD